MRDVGITIMPEFFQNEGVDAVLDNVVRRAGATAVATSPYVMEPARPEEGSREPPADAGAGKVRLLDRLLWGRRELWVRTAPSYAPDLSLYSGLRYQPARPDDLTSRDGDVVAKAVRSAKARGLQVQLQVQAAIPPGYRVQFGGPLDEDRPRLPDGSSPGERVDNNGSLASPHVLGLYPGAPARSGPRLSRDGHDSDRLAGIPALLARVPLFRFLDPRSHSDVGDGVRRRADASGTYAPSGRC